MTISRTGFALQEFAGIRGREARDLGMLFGQVATTPSVPESTTGLPQPVAPQGATAQQVASLTPPQQAPQAARRPMSMTPEIQAGIFGGESGGDYDALYQYAGREGGRFAGVRPTDMTIGQILDFTNPSGEYGQWVKSVNPAGQVSTPIGAYQVVGSTLRDAVRGLGLDLNQKFDRATQDLVGDWILKNQGVEAWEGYQGPRDPSTMSTRGGGGPGPAPDGPAPEGLFDEESDEEARGYLASLGAFFRGEEAPELDWRSAGQALSVGLGQMSWGRPVDISAVVDRQERSNLQRLAMYRQNRERRAAAQYAYKRGDANAAAAIMSGGMDLDTYLDENQRKILNERQAEQDRQSEVGRKAFRDYMLDSGASPEEAEAASYNPSAYMSAEQLRMAQDEVDRALEAEETGKTALAAFYGPMAAAGDANAQAVMDMLDANASVEMVEQAFDINASKIAGQVAQANVGIAQQNADTSSGQLDVARGGLDLSRDRFALETEATRHGMQVAEGGLAISQQNALSTQESNRLQAERIELERERLADDRAQAARDTDAATRRNAALAVVAADVGAPSSMVRALSAGVDTGDIIALADEARTTASAEQAAAARETGIDAMREVNPDAAFLAEIDPTIGLAEAMEMAKEPELSGIQFEYSLYSAQQAANGEPENLEEFYEMRKNPAVNNVIGGARDTLSRALNTAAGAEMADWIMNTGVTNENNLRTLQTAMTQLTDGTVSDNPGVRFLTSLAGGLEGTVSRGTASLILSMTGNASNLQVADAVQKVVSQSLKPILGGQFAYAEGQQLIQRSYNAALSAEQNAERVAMLVREMTAIQNERARAYHYALVEPDPNTGQPRGSLAGFMPSRPLSSVGAGEYLQGMLDDLDMQQGVQTEPRGATTFDPATAPVDELDDFLLGIE